MKREEPPRQREILEELWRQGPASSTCLTEYLLVTRFAVWTCGRKVVLYPCTRFLLHLVYLTFSDQFQRRSLHAQTTKCFSGIPHGTAMSGTLLHPYGPMHHLSLSGMFPIFFLEDGAAEASDKGLASSHLTRRGLSISNTALSEQCL